MAALKYFTLVTKAKTVVADTTADTDPDPDVKGIHSGVTITPTIKDSTGKTVVWVKAATLTDPALIIASPIKARIDNGQLVLRIDPDRDVDDYPNLAAFPATGAVGQLYRALDTGLVYEWTGSTYATTYGYAPIRLLALCPALGLGPGGSVSYKIEFYATTFNGQEQQLPAITIAAPEIAEADTTEHVLNLVSAAWL